MSDAILAVDVTGAVPEARKCELLKNGKEIKYMRQLLYIHDMLYAESLSDFRDELIRLGTYEPQLCEFLLNRIMRSQYYMGSRDPFALLLNETDRHVVHSMVRSPAHDPHENPWTRRFADLFSFFRRRRGVVRDDETAARARRIPSEELTARGIQRFLQRCQDQRLADPDCIDGALEDAVMQLYAGGAADAIKYLLKRADAKTQRMFSGLYLDAETLARQSTVSVAVRETDASVAITGNTGRFLVFLHQDSRDEVRLSFTNQASMVYYLMFLIHHVNHPECKTPVSLSRNREEFMRLYHCVYNISEEKLQDKVQHLLFREVDGNLRVGRENELRCDIRRHLDKAFAQFGESFQPYAMTAGTHLTVPIRLIRFLGDAQELKSFYFL